MGIFEAPDCLVWKWILCVFVVVCRLNPWPAGFPKNVASMTGTQVGKIDWIYLFCTFCVCRLSSSVFGNVQRLDNFGTLEDDLCAGITTPK